MKRRILCLVLSVVAVSRGFAAETGKVSALPPDSLSYNMNEVVVTATRTPLMLKDTPIITRVITAKDIQRRGVATLQQALEGELAGVEFHQAGYGSSLSFQGLDARYVLFLVDGERIAGETYGNIDYARIPMDNIARIEIVRGASSVLYGSNAMGAVVNLITRMPVQKYEINASLRYGTPFQRNGGDSLAGSATPRDSRFYRDKLDLPNLKGDFSIGFNLGKFKSLTAFSYRSTDAYRLVGTKNEVRHYDSLNMMTPKMIPVLGPEGNVVGMRPQMDPATGMPVFVVGRTVRDTTVSVAPDKRGLSVSGWRDINVSQRFDYELSDKFRFQVTGSYFSKNRYDFNGSILDENPMSNNSKPWTYESYSGYNVKAQMEHSPNRNNKIYLSFMHDGYYRNLDSLSSATVPKQRHSYNIPRLLWTFQAGEYNRLTTGVEMVNERLRFDLNRDSLGFDAPESMTSGSLYVQDEILNGHALSFVAGVLGNYNNRFGWSVTPKLSAKYTVGHCSLRANYASGYRTPSLKEMYMEFTVPIPGQTTVIRGNDRLRPETNHYVSLAAEYNREGVNFSATAYKSFFRNKIDVRGHAEGVETILQYENINRSQFAGVEVMANVRLARGLFVRANYNYIYQTDDAPESSTQYIFPSPHTATFQADYGFMIRKCYIGLNAAVRYVGAKDYEDFMPVLDMTGSSMASMKYWTGTYTAHHDGYAVCDAVVNATFPQRVTLSVGVNNMFNRQPSIVNFNSDITSPRNMFVRISYAFGHD